MNAGKQQEFNQLTNNLIKWLNENGHPHMQIVVTTTNAQLFEGVISHVTKEYLRD